MKNILNLATRPHLGYPGYEKPPEDNFWPPRSAHGKWSNLWLPKQKFSPNSFWFNHVKMFLENHIEPYGSTPAGAGGWPRTCHTQVPPQVLVRLAHRRPQPPATWNNFAAVGVLGSKLLGHASIFGRMAEQMQTVRFSDVLMQTIAKWSSHQGKWIFFWTLQIIVNREMQILSPEPCRLQAARFNTTGISARCYTQELIGSGGILTLFINHSKQGPCHIYFLLNFGQWSPSPTRSHCQIKNWHQHLSRSTPYPSIFCRIRNYLLDSLSQLRR